MTRKPENKFEMIILAAALSLAAAPSFAERSVSENVRKPIEYLSAEQRSALQQEIQARLADLKIDWDHTTVAVNARGEIIFINRAQVGDIPLPPVTIGSCATPK